MFSFFVTLFCFFLAVQASPLSLAADDVFVPEIISPNSTTVWVIGQTESVTWVASNAPKNISNGAAVFLSGYATALASNFDLRAGKVDVYVPENVQPGDCYITLFGDSGNESEHFRVEAPKLSS